MIMFDDIFLFIKVIQIGGFRASAKILNLSMPTISKRINELEKSLGYELIKRNAQNFKLTPAGSNLYAKFIKIYEEFSTNTEELLCNSNEVKGTLRVSLPGAIARKLILPHIGTFHAKYPEVNLIISFASGNTDFAGQGIDIAISASLPCASNSYSIKKIKEFHTKLFATPKYIEDHIKPKSIYELTNCNLVGLAENGQIKKIYSAKNLLTDQEKIFEYTPKIALDNVMQSIELAYENNLIVMLMDILIEDELNQGVLIPIMPDYSFHDWVIYLVQNKNQPSKLQYEFANFLEECFVRTVEKC